jgi:hypothetical protein
MASKRQRQKRRNCITEMALRDDEFMRQTIASLDALERGERGIPLRDIQAAEKDVG